MRVQVTTSPQISSFPFFFNFHFFFFFFFLLRHDVQSNAEVQQQFLQRGSLERVVDMLGSTPRPGSPLTKRLLQALATLLSANAAARNDFYRLGGAPRAVALMGLDDTRTAMRSLELLHDLVLEEALASVETSPDTPDELALLLHATLRVPRTRLVTEQMDVPAFCRALDRLLMHDTQPSKLEPALKVAKEKGGRKRK